MPQLGFNLLEEFEQEDVDSVLTELSVQCTACRLSQLHPFNRGLVYRGNPLAKIAVVGGVPNDGETEKGSPFTGVVGKEFEKWMTYIGLDVRKDLFLTNILHCQPPKKLINGRHKTRDPEKDEINACFGPRTLRILRAMPNLEVVLVLGWISGKAFLGTSDDTNVPKTKTHEGGWFESSLLPGIGIFCLNHPGDIVHSDSDEKKMTIQKFLDYFKREALEDDKIKRLAAVARERREELGLGVF
jgi:uracil-DNA glycosylase family 4